MMIILRKSNNLDMIILIDMDDVLADFDGEFYRVWNILHPEKPITPPGARKHFYIKDESPAEYQPLISEINTSPGFIRSLPVIKGGAKAINEMKNEGHSVFICTSPLLKYHNCVKEKYEWVEAHLGTRWIEKLILTRDKTLIKSDILIDDKPEITGAAEPSWEHVLFDKPYNRHITDKKRITWGEWKETLFN
jgi:5'-nucleotidase